MEKLDNAKDARLLGEEKIGKLLLMYSVPSIIALLVNSTYEMVDQIFIGRSVGYLGNGATNIFMPLTVLAMGLTMMLGDGTASFLSIYLGKGDKEKAARGVTTGVIWVTIVGILFFLVFQIFLHPLCNIFGATEEILPYAEAYGRIRLLGMPFCCINAGFSSMIRADGSPKYSMCGLLCGCAVNIIGDSLFLFVFHWGIQGAALATILGQLVNGVLCIRYLWHFKSVSLRKMSFKENVKELKEIARLGMASVFIQTGIVLTMIIQNNLYKWYGARSKYGAEIPLAAMGITMQVFVLVSMVVNGLASGAQPIFGYNYGAGNIKRVKQTLRMVLVTATIITTIAFLWFQLNPYSIIYLFGSKSSLYNEFLTKGLRIFLLFVFLDGFQLSGGIFFQAIGYPVYSTILSISRQILFLIPAMVLLARPFGIEGILWAGPVADGLAFLLAVFMIQNVLVKMHKTNK